MKLKIEAYSVQKQKWPQRGKHILAQYDREYIIVYQAYNQEIGNYAVKNQHFGGAFKFTRMSWIKTSFLWMMYRSGWGTKPNQEIILAIRLKRSAFDFILKNAVHTAFVPEIYKTYDAWKHASTHSDIHLQWDPDHNPTGQKVERRAIQLGLRGNILKKYAKEWIIDIENISNFVQTQNIMSKELLTPQEHIYPSDLEEE
jgi:hypothetical protein